MTPFLQSAFSALTVCNIHFWIWKYMWSPFWSILVWKIFQFLTKSYHRFGQLIILFKKVNSQRLLKIYFMFCPPARAKYSFFSLQLRDFILWSLVTVSQSSWFICCLELAIPLPDVVCWTTYLGCTDNPALRASKSPFGVCAAACGFEALWSLIT